MRGVALVFGGLVLAASVAGAEPGCPGTATVTLFVENESAAPTVDVALDGELAPDTVTCAGTGATTYQASFTCEGHGRVRCGELEGLRPGLWVHRLAVTVPGSAPQRQAQRLLLVAGSPADVANALVWTVYPRTFVVDGTAPDGLRMALELAKSFATADSHSALVTFAPDAFPGAGDPKRIAFLEEQLCADGKKAALCIGGDRLVVDGLDRDARPGAVILSVGELPLKLVRIFGSDVALRGLVLEGSRAPAPSIQLDTVAIAGASARRNRIEQSLVVGPSNGDAVGVDSGAGRADDARPGDNVVADSRITGAEDRGVKINDAVAAVVGSCVHDNRNGGIQSTLGGYATVVESIVQHNVPGASQNGITVLGTTAEARSLLHTRGNVVRFSGARGVTVTDNAEAYLESDYVADNQNRGSTVDTTKSVPQDDLGMDLVPKARFHGVALVCNHRDGLTGRCTPPPGNDPDVPCTGATKPRDCCTKADGTIDDACAATTACLPQDNDRFGAVTFVAPCAPGSPDACRHAPPDVGYGGPFAPGRNAFASNVGEPGDANFAVEGITTPIPAVGNQWEHWATGVAQDLSPPDAPVDVGVPGDPRDSTSFEVVAISPPRPWAGDVVRVYGDGFNAIDGNPTLDKCAVGLAPCSVEGTCPTGPCVDGTCPCAADNAAVRLRNMQTEANRIRIRTGSTTLATIYPDAVTPTMLVFRMPWDCFAPLVLEVAKRDVTGRRVSRTIGLCDPRGCEGKAPGAPCTDGNACTGDDRCDGEGHCIGGEALGCAGDCRACNVASGECEPRPAGVVCRFAADACDAPETCDGIDGECPPDVLQGASVVCREAMGLCDMAETCTGQSASCPDDAHVPAGTTCRPAAGPCDVAEACDGVAATCPPDAFSPDTTVCRAATDPCEVADTCPGPSTACPAIHRPKTGFDAMRCAFERSLSPAPCTGPPPPRVATRFGKASDDVARAATAAGKQRDRLLRHAIAALRRSIRGLERAVHRRTPPMSRACAGAVRAILRDARARVEANRH